MTGPWPPEVVAAIQAYREAQARWHAATEAIPYSEVEIALMSVGQSCVAWAERVERLPAERPKPLAARGGSRAPVRRRA